MGAMQRFADIDIAKTRDHALVEQRRLGGRAAPDEALRKRLTHVFRNGHPNSRNRLQQTFKDWDRISGKPRTPGAP